MRNTVVLSVGCGSSDGRFLWFLPFYSTDALEICCPFFSHFRALEKYCWSRPPLLTRLRLSGCFSLSSINISIYRFIEMPLSASSTAFFPNAFLTAFFSPTVFFFFASFTLSHFQQPFALPPFFSFSRFHQLLPKCLLLELYYQTRFSLTKQ